MKKLSFAGMGKDFERRMPVRLSPPGGRLQRNWELLSPSEDSRVWRNQGLAEAMPLIGRLRHSSESGSTEASKLRASSAPQSASAGFSLPPRWPLPSWTDLNRAS